MSYEFRLNRMFSKPLTSLLLKTPVTPNQVTLGSLFLGILAGCLFSRGIFSMEILAALCYLLAGILDNCDGEIARSKNRMSAWGAWLDIVSDILVDLSLFLGLAVGAARKGVAGPIVFFTILCLSGALFHFSLVILEKLKGFGPAAFGAPHPEHKSRKNFFLTCFDALREGDTSWFVLLFVLFHKTEYLLWIGGLYMQLLWISAVVINFKWYFSSVSRETR